MKYRVIVVVGYNEAWYDFDNIEAAGDFARTVLIHQIPNKDTRKKDHVRLEVIDTTITDAEDEEE